MAADDAGNDSKAAPADKANAGVKAAPDYDYSQDRESYGRYLFGGGITKGGFGADTEFPKWGDFSSTRIMARVFSRGLLGTTLYTFANRWASREMPSYQLAEKLDWNKPLHVIARGFDIALGTPIKGFVKGYYRLSGLSVAESIKMAEDATTFRPLRAFNTAYPQVLGRSLGAEITAMTIDFAAGSTGDAIGRNLVNVLDPNVRLSWQRDDGSTDYQQMAKASLKEAWKIFSKNQGEDWAAALPYVYQMRFQRQLLNRIYPGFVLSSDYQHNGGSWRVDQQGNMLSSYTKAGALDLQARFTGYNWYTLMYRDAYDAAASAIHHWRATGETPKVDLGENPLLGGIEALADSARYVVKSAIKATIYMTPAVPFFWAVRTPQTKYRGMLVHVDENGTPSEFKGRLLPEAERFLPEHTRGVLDRMINPFGRACDSSARSLIRGAKNLGFAMNDAQKSFTHDWVNASFSYTPYMIAKAETALRWDRPANSDGLNAMDRAIYRLIDGACALKIGEVGGALSDIREQVIHPQSNRKIELAEDEIRSRKRTRLADITLRHKDEAGKAPTEKDKPASTVDAALSSLEDRVSAPAKKQAPASAHRVDRKIAAAVAPEAAPHSGVTIH